MFDKSWKPLTSLWCRRQQLGVCVLKGKIYAVAGSDGDNRLNSVEVFDYTTNSWDYSTPLQVNFTFLSFLNDLFEVNLFIQKF